VNSRGATRYHQNVLKNTKLYSLKLHPIHKTIVTGEDRIVRVWDLDTNKETKSIENK
jgi:WD40 repeat protein